MKKAVDVQIPNLPNYIKVGTVYTSIADFSIIELRQIGTEWTNALIEKAKKN